MVTEEITPKAPEWFEEMRCERQRNVQELMDELMAEAGIESLEELHRHYVETEYAYVPVPGLHRGKPISFEVFKRLAVGRPRFIYGEFIEGMLEVLGVDRRSREGLDFILTYMVGKRLGDYPK